MDMNGFSVNQKLFNEVSHETEIFMYKVGITEKPALYSFEDDKGIFEKLFSDHITEPNVLALKTISEDLYLRVLGMHALGAGAYAAAKQLDFGHGVSEFTDEETKSIFADFDRADAFELALEKLGVSPDSGNRKILDRIILIAIKESKLSAREKIAEPQNLKGFMRVLYNAGASLYMLRKNNR